MSDNAHKYPSQMADRFQVRMSEGLRERIRLAAESNNRSMNSEIVATLEEKYPPPDVEDEVRELLELYEKLSVDRQKAFRDWAAKVIEKAKNS